MAVWGRHAARRRRAAIAVVAGSGALLAIVAGFTGALTLLVARVVVTPPRGRTEKTRILAVDMDTSTITLARSLDTELPGRYGLWFSFDTGHLKLGQILAHTPDTVTRRIDHVDFGDPTTAHRGRFSGWIFQHPREIDVESEEVMIPTAVGDAPAWVIRTRSPSMSWVVLIHGRGVKRAEALRAVPVYLGLGYNCMVVSWRNDGEAPASGDRRYALGGTEWADVDAALGYIAADLDGTDVVLMGWSMGGAIALQTAARTQHPHLIRGIVLESPVVDWAPTLDFQAKEMKVPAPLRHAVLSVLAGGRSHRLTGLHQAIDFSALDFVTRAAEISVPVLVMHSDDDGFVPSTASRRLAAVRPDLVTLRSWTGARHAKLWNYDPVRFDREITEWVHGLPTTD